MTVTIPKIFVSILGFTLLSCSPFDNSSINLIGTWTLDSISTLKYGYMSAGNCQSLTFYNKADYKFISVCGDVHKNFTGKYFILNNPKRGLKTIALIPDIDINDKDTIRIGYSNFDIVSLTANRLQVVEETEFIN